MRVCQYGLFRKSREIGFEFETGQERYLLRIIRGTDDKVAKTSLESDYELCILGVAFYSCLIFSGCLYFVFSLFVKPLQAELGWDRSTIMAAFTFLFLSIGSASPFAGRAVDRYGAKVVMAMGALVSALGFVLLIFLDSPFYYYILYACIGIGGAAFGPVPATALVSERFQHRRGLAIGLTSTGIGIGGFVLAPLVGGLIIPRLGWRAGYLGIGLLIGTLIPLTLWGIKSRAVHKPTDQHSQLQEESDVSAKVVGDTGSNFRAALLSPPFLLIAGAFMLSQFGINGTVQSQVPHLQDIGYPLTTASAALGGIGLISAASKLFFGWLCDLIKPKYAFCIGVAFMACATCIFMFVKPTSPSFLLWAYSFVMGIGAGSWLPSMSMLISTNFGLVSYGSIFGAVTFAHNVGVSTGPLFAGYMYDITEGYYWAFLIFLICYGVSIPSMLMVRPRVR